MKMLYIDESGTYSDDLTALTLASSPRLSSHFILVAIIVDIDAWQSVFTHLKSMRKDIKHNYKVPIHEYLHANELISGARVWKHIKFKHLHTGKRKGLLKYVLNSYAALKNVQVISVTVDKLSSYPSINPNTCKTLAYNNLLNRVEKTFPNEKYLMIIDGQEDMDVVRTVRKQKVVNFILSENRPLLSSVEDPLFKNAKHSFFLQMADHIAYTLLHVFDQRNNKDLGDYIKETNILNNLGVKQASKHSKDYPGVVFVPR